MRGLTAGGMRVGALRALAVATTPAERARRGVTVAALALAGALVIAAARVARLDGTLVGVAAYLAQPGLRPGVIASAVLLAVPVLLLARQALALGSTARARRTRALLLAGADRGRVRWVAAAGAVPAGLLGGLLAGPVYLLAWGFLGVLPPRAGMRLLPTPDAGDAAVWGAVVLVAAVAAGAVGAVDAMPRRRARASGRRVAVAAVVVVVGIAAVSLLLGSPLPLLLAPPLLAAPVTFLVAGRMRRAGSVTDLLAGSRLAAAPGPAARSAALLAVCGMAWGLQAALMLTVLQEQVWDVGFYLVGIGLTAVVAVLAAAAAVTGLLVAAADQVLSSPRAAASLAALGLDGSAARRVLRRQLTAVGAPLAAAGVLVVLPAVAIVDVTGAAVDVTGATVAAVLGVLLAVWLAVHGIAALSVLAVGPTLERAAAATNLRAG